jgi:hypothetical protein
MEALPDPAFGTARAGEGGLFQRIQLGLQWSANGWQLELLPAWHAAVGLERSRPADRSPIDLQRAHLGWTSPEEDLRWRLGRQSLRLGQGRILSTSNSSNQQQAFDAAQIWIDGGRWQWQALWAMPVRIDDGSAFDDRRDPAQRIYGLQLATQPAEGTSLLEAQLLRYRLQLAGITEVRDGLGLRYSGPVQNWRVDLEGQWQDGHSGDRSAHGWLLAASASAPLPANLQLKLQLDLGSGDDPDTIKNERYLPFFPSRSAFSQGAFTGYSNLRHIKTGLSWSRAEASLALALGLMQRMRTDDAVYLHTRTPLIGSAGASDARRSGHYWQLKGSLPLARQWEMGLELVRFEAGPAVRAAGGRDQNYAGLSLEWSVP